jgi:hypothetical protein
LVEFLLSSYCPRVRGEDIQRSVIFVVHGFGGLVYEQVGSRILPILQTLTSG